jgi:hypothetical protein
MTTIEIALYAVAALCTHSLHLRSGYAEGDGLLPGAPGGTGTVGSSG